MAVRLSDLLPKPSSVSEDWGTRDPWFRGHEGATQLGEASKISPAASKAVAIKEPPPYGKRDAFVPRDDEDYGDGGAFPELFMAQFPLAMGRTGNSARQIKANTLALQVDQDGKVRYDALIKQGQSKEKVIYSKLADTKGSILTEDDESLSKPDEEQVKAIAESTREALEKITNTKIAASLPVRHADKQGPAQYIRYTPSQQGPAYAAGSQQRIIKMVEMQKDPMEPPKFKINQKIPAAPPSPPAPVMHSPTRKVTAKEQSDWKIPPCISNWKNPKGYTIPLDKRLASDGRGLQQVHINENFAKLSEALYLADRKAREAVEMRSQLERRLAQKKKEEQEEKMRQLAAKAREERQGMRRRGDEQEQQEVDAEQEREQLRRERQNDRRRERNIARAAPEKQAALRSKEKDRDISEKIALGLPDARRRDGDTQFDERLFNQSKGLDSGGGLDDETYAVYDRPMRSDASMQRHIYRPTKAAADDVYGADLDRIVNTNRFVPDRGFSGAEPSGTGDPSSGKRQGPVQFERDQVSSAGHQVSSAQQSAQQDDDPFGLGSLLAQAREGSKRKVDDAGGRQAKRDRR